MREKIKELFDEYTATPMNFFELEKQVLGLFSDNGSNKRITKRPTKKYKYCNHHHEISDNHKLVDFGDGKFVANKEAIPLLKALNEIGLRTRSHHIDEKEHAWIYILLDNAEIEVKEVFEQDANRTKYNGKKELLIRWYKQLLLPNSKLKGIILIFKKEILEENIETVCTICCSACGEKGISYTDNFYASDEFWAGWHKSPKPEDEGILKISIIGDDFELIKE